MSEHRLLPFWNKPLPDVFTEKERALLLDVYRKIFRGETIGSIDVAEFAVKQGEAQHAVLFRDHKDVSAFRLKGCFFCEVLEMRSA